jgi:hypothetical protein
MAQALMRDETMSGRELDAWILPGLPDTITARELVRLRVREEVARFNAAGGDVFRGLVRPAAGSETEQGVRVPAGARIDWRAQADAACDAFARNGFFILIDDRQAESLDEEITLRPDTNVAFVKLTPLVGG